MSDDKSDKAGGWFGNPLPIVMVVLLAAGVLVKNIPLESARPTDPERVKFSTTSQQDVEARLWQDPFAAVENYEKSSKQAVTPEEETLPTSHLPEALCKNIKKRQDEGTIVTVIAVSVSGGSYAEAAESRRRSRFAVDSALDFHHYHPENAEALGYFRIDLPESQSTANTFNLTVPYEWFETRGKSSAVLVLWLNEDKLTSEPLTNLRTLFDKLTPIELAGNGKGLRAKIIGPAGSAMLRDLIRESTDPNRKPIPLKSGSTLEVYSPSATISSCDLKTSGTPESTTPWDCFMMDHSTQPTDRGTLPILRTTGTDDVLSAALLWELWQRGVNRTRADKRQCADGLVLIGERDSEYGRTLSRYLQNGFSDRCGATTSSPVRTFNYLRGLDGVLPDIDKSDSKAPPKDNSSRSKNLRAQLEDAPPEHAEGRSQFDYLRRLADEIDRLDRDREFFAENGVKAIGLVGSDLYDKLLILQALRSRFKDKIFFTTDLDARYLHADQNDWARNLVVASNFGLSLRPALQRSTLPFRDSYQTATYLATLVAIENQDQPFDWTLGMENSLRPGLQQSTQPILDNYLTASYLAPPMAHKQPFDWKEWLRPQIFEIGRTQAIHLASPSVKDLTDWIESDYSKDSAPRAKDVKCDGNWTECENIEPDWPPQILSLEHLSKILIMLCLGIFLVALANRRVNETVRAAFAAPSPKRDAARTILYVVTGTVVVVFMILAIVWTLMDESLTQGIGEPFVWFEGVSVWPSLVVRFVCLVTMLSLWYAFLKMIQQKEKPDKDFEIALPKIRKLDRSKLHAWLKGPHLNLALFDKEGNAETNSIVREESAEKKIIDVATLWQNYLRATSWREMAGWIVASLLIGVILFFAAFKVFDRPSFPHRGELVKTLHFILVFSNALVLWSVIFWVGYETRACARFIETLSNARSLWSTVRLDREEASTGVPRAHLDDYLDFQLIVHATQRIHWLIYLPFVSILFMVLARSNFFDAMDFPLALVFVIGLALGYSLHSARLLRKSAEAARATALENYETRLLTQARATDSQPPFLMASPVSAEQIKILMERIRGTREGAFAPFAQQPALQALLLPFGGYGSVQIIEYLFKL
jgi:hypothetical protein